MTREFSEAYNDRDVIDVFVISKCMIKQIDYYLDKEELTEINRQFLTESKKAIEEILAKYDGAFNTIQKISYEQIEFGFSEMCDNPKYQGLSPEEYKRTYENSSVTLGIIKQDFERICKIEDTIHDLITIPLWKKSITSMDEEIKPGDEFAYIVHAGRNIIFLPGYPNYEKTRNFNADYVSASLLTDKQMAMFGESKVGLIIKANEAIVCSAPVDSGTNITNIRTPRTIMDFKNGYYIEAGFPGEFIQDNEELATTKIQSPNQLTEDTIKKQNERGIVFSSESRDVNEIVLDETHLEVVGVFFKTNGCEINFADFERAIIMGEKYNVPIRIVNSSIYRRKLGLEPYEQQDLKKYALDVEFWSNSDNWKEIMTNPEEDRNFIKKYFNDVVVKQQYDPEIRKKIEEIFTRMIEYTYNSRNAEKSEDDKKVEFGE